MAVWTPIHGNGVADLPQAGTLDIASQLAEKVGAVSHGANHYWRRGRLRPNQIEA